MGLSCSAAVVALFLLELNSTLVYQDLPADLNAIPVENHELVVSRTHSQGSVIDSNFSNVRILHVQEDPAYNPYFGLNNQSSTLYSKVSLNQIQNNTGTFLMAVNKQNNTQVETLYCVTYCIGNLTDPSVQEVCVDTVNSETIYVSSNESLLSQHIYEKHISHLVPPGYVVLHILLKPGNMSNVFYYIKNPGSRLFFVDHLGVLRTGRKVTEEDMAVHELKVMVSATISDEPRLDLALVKVKVEGESGLKPTFEQPDGYTFIVKEGEVGLSVGFVKALDHDGGLNGTVTYSFDKQQDTSFFQLNETSGEIHTAVPLDRETADSYVLTVNATDQSFSKPLTSQVDVYVLVEDVNDNPPVFVKKEYSLSLSLYTQPGLLLRVNATDADVGQNAKVMYTITEGNVNELFWINSTSGELFLMAPLTVSADDSVSLLIKAQNNITANSLEDTALVRMTFYGIGSKGAQESTVAVVSGVSVACFLFVVAVVVFSLYIWRKRRKSKQERRRKYESLSALETELPHVESTAETTEENGRYSQVSMGSGMESESRLISEGILHPRLSGSIPKQRSESSLLQQQDKETDWRSPPSSHVSLDLSGIESVSMSPPLLSKERHHSLLPDVESTAEMTEGERRYSQVSVQFGEMESESPSPSAKQRFESSLSSLERQRSPAGLSSLKGSRGSIFDQGMDSDFSPQVRPPQRPSARASSLIEPLESEPSDSKTSQIGLVLGALETELPHIESTAETTEEKRSYSQVSIELSGMESESPPPSPKQRLENSFSSFDGQHSPEAVKPPVSSLKGSRVSVYEQGIETNTSPPSQSVEQVFQLSSSAIEPLKSVPSDSKTSPISLVVSELEAELPSFLSSPSLISEGIILRPRLSASIPKQRSESSLLQQQDKETDWRSPPSSHVSLDLSGIESVSMSPPLLSKERHHSLLSDVESTAEMTEGERRYSQVSVQFGEMESESPSPSAKQRFESSLSSLERQRSPAGLSSLKGSRESIFDQGMDSDFSPQVRPPQRPSARASSLIEPLESEPSDSKTSQIGLVLGALETELPHIESTAETTEEKRSYSQVSIELSGMESESPPPSPKQRLENSFSSFDGQHSPEAVKPPVSSLKGSRVSVYEQGIETNTSPPSQSVEQVFQLSSSAIEPLKSVPSDSKTSPISLVVSELEAELPSFLSSPSLISEGIILRPRLSASIPKQRSESSLLQQQDKETDWRSPPSSHVSLDLSGIESVSMSPPLLSKERHHSLLPDVESTAEMTEGERRYSQVSVQFGEMESESPSPSAKQRFESSLSLLERQRSPAGVSSLKGSRESIFDQGMDSDFSPQVRPPQRPSARASSLIEPLESEPSDSKTSQIGLVLGALETELPHIESTAETTEEKRSYSQVSIELSGMESESPPPSPKQRLENSFSSFDGQHSPEAVKPPVSSLKGSRVSVYEQGIETNTSPPSQSVEQVFQLSSSAIEPLKSVPSDSKTSPISLVVSELEAELPSFLSSPSLISEGIVLRPRLSASIPKQRSESSLLQQQDKETDWRSPPSSHVSLDLSGIESVSMSPPLLSKKRHHSLLPDVESTAEMTEGERRYSQVSVQFGEMESESPSPSAKQRFESSLSSLERQRSPAGVSSLKGSRESIFDQGMDSDFSPQVRPPQRPSARASSLIEPLESEPSDSKTSQIGLVLGALETELPHIESTAETTEEKRSYSQVSIELSGMESESPPPSPKQRLENSFSSFDGQHSPEAVKPPVSSLKGSRVSVYEQGIETNTSPPSQSVEQVFQLSSSAIEPLKSVPSDSKTSPISLVVSELEAELPSFLSSPSLISEGIILRPRLSASIPKQRSESSLLQQQDKETDWRSPPSSHVSLDLSGIESVSMSPPLLSKELPHSLLPDVESTAGVTEGERRYSQVSVQFGEMESESPSPSAKQRFESSLSSLERQRLPAGVSSSKGSRGSIYDQGMDSDSSPRIRSPQRHEVSHSNIISCYVSLDLHSLETNDQSAQSFTEQRSARSLTVCELPQLPLPSDLTFSHSESSQDSPDLHTVETESPSVASFSKQGSSTSLTLHETETQTMLHSPTPSFTTISLSKVDTPTSQRIHEMITTIVTNAHVCLQNKARNNKRQSMTSRSKTSLPATETSPLLIKIDTQSSAVESSQVGLDRESSLQRATQSSQDPLSVTSSHLMTAESTKSTKAQPTRSLSDSLISTVSVTDVETYMSGLAPELFRQSKTLYDLKTELSSRHEVSLVDTDSTSSSPLKGDEFLSADEAEDLETFPPKKESTSNMLQNSQDSLEPDAVDSRNVTPFEVEGSVASLKESQPFRLLPPMPHSNITSSPVSLDLHAVDRESASVESFSKQGSSPSLKLHVIEAESQVTLSSLRPSCTTRSMVNVASEWANEDNNRESTASAKSEKEEPESSQESEVEILTTSSENVDPLCYPEDTYELDDENLDTVLAVTLEKTRKDAMLSLSLSQSIGDDALGTGSMESTEEGQVDAMLSFESSHEDGIQLERHAAVMKEPKLTDNTDQVHLKVVSPSLGDHIPLQELRKTVSRSGREVESEATLENREQTFEVLSSTISSDTPSTTVSNVRPKKSKLSLKFREAFNFGKSEKKRKEASALQHGVPFDDFSDESREKPISRSHLGLFRGKNRAGPSHLPVSALLSSILPVDQDSSLSTSNIPLEYTNVESTLFDDDKKYTHSSTQDDQGTLPSETSQEIILSSFPDHVIEGEMQCAPPSPNQTSKSSLSEKGSTLSPPARKSTCDLVDSSETKPGLPTLETTGRKPTRCLSDSLVSSCTSNDDVGLLSSLSEGHVATSVAVKELQRGLATSCQDPDSLKLQPKASSKSELPLAKETSSFVDSSQGSPDLRAVESETASTLLHRIQNSENLFSEIPLPLSKRELTESTEAQPIRCLSDSLISTVSLNEDLGLSNDVESYMSCLAPELFRQSKPFHEMKTEPSSRHEVSLVDTDSTSSSPLEGDEFFSADEAEDLETFPSKKESKSNILHNSQVSLEPDAVGSRNVTPFKVEGSAASLKENQSSRRLLPMPHSNITSSPVTLDLHSAEKQIQSTKPFPEQRSVSSLSVCEPTPLTLANDSKSRITESSQVSLDFHAVERESASVKSFTKQGSSTSLELHVIETESQATLSSLRPSCITRSLVKVDDATSSRIHEMITAIVKNAQICLQHKARDSETALSPQSMTSRSKRSSSATETLPLVINKETSSSTVNNSQVGLDLHSLLPSPTQRSQNTLSDTLSVITTAESTESAEPKLPRSLTKLMSLSGSFNVDAHESTSGISESSQAFPDLHAVEAEGPSAELFSKQESVNSPSASEDIRGKQRAGSSHLPVSALLSSILPVDKDSSLYTSDIPLEYAKVESTLFDDDKKSTHSSTQDDQGTLPSETSHEIIFSSFADHVVEGEMQCAPPSPKEASKSSLSEKGSTLSPPARKSTCDLVDSSETKPGLPTLETTGRKPTRCLSDSLVSSCTSNDDVCLLSSLSEGHVATSVAIKELQRGLATSFQVLDSLKLQPKASSKPELPLAKETSSFVDSSQGSPDLRAVESETASTLLCPIQNSENLFSEITLPLSTRESTESTEAQPIRSLSDSLISTVSLNEDLGLSNDVESYMSCLAPELFWQFKPFHEMKTEPSSRHEVSLVDTDSTSSSPLEGEEFLSADEAEDLETFPSKKESTSNILHNSQGSLEPDAVGSRNVTPFKVEGSAASLKENQSSRRLLPMPHSNITSSSVTLDLHSAEKQIQSTKPFPEQRSVSSLSVCEPTPLTLANDSKSRITESSQVSLDLHAVERESASVKSFTKQGSSTSLELHVIETENQATLSSLRPSCITRSLVKVDDATSSRIHEMITAIVKNAQICLQHKARDSETPLSPQSMTSRSKRSSSATETLPLVINKETSSSTVNNSQVGLDLHSLLPSPTQRSQNTLSDTLSVITTAESTESAEPKLPHSLTKLMSLSGSFNVDAHESISGISESSQAFPDLHAVEAEGPSAELFSKQEYVNSPSASEDIRGKQRAGSSHLPVSALLSSILPVDKDSSLSTSDIPLEYAKVESTLFDDDKKSTHSSTQDDQGTLPSETSHEIIFSSFADHVIEGEMQCAPPSPKEASKSSLSEKGSTLSPPARKSTCDLVDSSETKPGLPTLETTGRKPTRCLSDSLVSSCTSNDDVCLLSSLSEGHVATSVAIKELQRGLATSFQVLDSLKLQPKASSKPELPLAKETSSFVDSSQGSPDLRAVESETASTLLCPIQNSENLFSEITLPLSTRESTESTEAQPIRSLSDSLISTVSLNEDLGLSNDVESYMSCLAPELFWQFKPFHEMKTEPSSRHEVSLVDTDSTSSSPLEGEEFLSADEAEDLETFPSKKESTSNILHNSQGSLEPDAVGSRNVTPFKVEGSAASLKENQSSRRLLPMPHSNITSSSGTLDLHSAEKQIQSTKPFPEQRSVSSLSVCEPTPLTLANDSKSRITESSQVSLDLHAVERESASVKSFTKQGSSTSLELHVIETESQATLSSLRPSCITRSLVKVDDATSSRIHEMITAIVKNAQICLQHKARDSETPLSPQSMTSRSKRSSSATETLPLVINKETSSSTVNNSQVGLDLHSLLPSPTQRSQNTLSDTLSVITTAESTESAEPKLPRSLTKLMSLSGSFNVDAHESISGISESSQVFPDLHAVEAQGPSAESFSKEESVNSPSASEDIPLPTNISSIIIVDNFHARLDHVADKWANEDNIRKITASEKSEKEEPESSQESEVEILTTSSENVDPLCYPEDTYELDDENLDTVLAVTLEKTRKDAMLSLSLSQSIGDDALGTGSMESTEEGQVDAMLSFESCHEDGIQLERHAAVMKEPKLTDNTDQVHSKVVSPSLGDDIPLQELRKTVSRSGREVESEASLENREQTLEVLSSTISSDTPSTTVSNIRPKKTKLSLKFRKAFNFGKSKKKRKAASALQPGVPFDDFSDELKEKPISRSHLGLFRGKQRAGSSHLPVSALLSSILPVDKDSSLSTSDIPLEYANVESTLFDDDKKSTHSSTQDDQGTLPSETSHEIILSSFPDHVIEGEMQCAAPSPKQASKSSLSEKGSTLPPLARKSTCDLVDSSETKPGLPTSETTGRKPTRWLSDSLVSSCTSNDDIGLLSSLSEGHVATSVAIKELERGLATSFQDPDSLKLQPKASSKSELPLAKETSSFVDSSQGSPDLRAVESETASTFLCPIQNSENLFSEIPLPLSTRESTESTEAQPIRCLSDSLISTVSLNEDLGLSNDVESYMSCLAPELFRQSKPFHEMKTEPSSRHEVSVVDTDSTSSSPLEGDEFLSADEAEDLETFPSKKESTSNILHNSQGSLEPDAVGSRNVTPFKVEGSAASLKENQSSRRLLPMPQSNITSSHVTLDPHSAEKQIQSTKPFPEQRSVSSLSVCEPTPLTLANDSKSRITESSQVSLDLHAVERESASVKSFSKQGSSTSLELHVIETESQATLSSLRPSCITRSLVKVDDATSSRIHEMITAIVKNAQICLQHKARDSETALSPQSMTSRSKRSSSATETLPLVINKETSSSTVNNSQVGLDLHSLLPSPTQRSQNTLSDTLSVITTAESTESAEPKLPRSLTKLMSLSGSFNVDAHESISGISESSQVFPDLHAVEAEGPSAESFSKEESVNSPSASEDIPLPTNISSIIIVDNFHARLDHVADKWANEDNIRKSTASEKSEKEEPESSQESEVEILTTSSENVDPLCYPEDTYELDDENLDTVLAVTLEKTRKDAMLSLSLSQSIGDDALGTGSMESTEEGQVDAMLSFESSHEDGIQLERHAAVMKEPKLTDNTDQVHSKVVSPSLGDDIPLRELRKTVSRSGREVESEASLENREQTLEVLSSTISSDTPSTTVSNIRPKKTKLSLKFRKAFNFGKSKKKRKAASALQPGVPFDDFIDESKEKPISRSHLGLFRGKQRAGSSHLPVSALLSSILPVDKDSSLSTSDIPLEYANVESTLFDDDKKSTHSSTQDDQGTLPSETSHEIILSSFPDHVIEGEMQCAALFPKQASKSSLSEKGSTLPPLARKSTCDPVDSSETKPGLPTLETTGRKPTRCLSDSLVSSCTSNDDIGLLSSLSEGHVATSVAIKELQRGLATSCQDPDSLKLQPKASSKPELPLAKETSSFVDSSQGSPDLRAIESETASTFLCPIQNSENLFSEIPLPLSTRESTESTEAQPIRCLSDSLISTVSLNEDLGLSNDVESYMSCLAPELFWQSKPFHEMKPEPSSRHEVSVVDTDSTSSSPLEGEEFLSADEAEDLETFPSKKESTSNILRNSQGSLEPDAVGSRNVTPFKVEGSAASLKENQSSRRLLPMPQSNITSSHVTLDPHSAEKQIQSTKPFPEQRSVSSLSVCEPTPLTLANDSKSRITESSQVSLDLHAVERESASVKSFSKQGSSTSLELHVIETESQATLSSLRPSCITRSLVKVDDATSSRIHEMITAIVKNAQICLQHKARDSETALSPQSMTSRSKRSSSATETLPLVINKETSSSTVNNSQVGLDLHSLLPSPTQRSQNTLSDTLSVITTAESTESAEPKLPRSLTKLMSLSGNFNVDAHESISGVAESSQVFPDVHAVEVEGPSPESFSKQESVDSPSASEDIPLPTNISSIIIVDNFHARLDHVADKWANEDNIRKSTASKKSEKEEPESSQESEVEILATSPKNVDPLYYPEDTHGLGDENLDTVLAVTLEKTLEDAMLSLSLSESIGDDALGTSSMESTGEGQVDAMLSFESSHEDVIQLERDAAVMETPKLTDNTDQVHSKVVSPSLGDDIPLRELRKTVSRSGREIESDASLENREQTLEVLSSTISSDTPSTTVSNIRPKKTKLSMKFRKAFKFGKSKKKRKAASALQPGVPFDDFSDESREKPISRSHLGLFRGKQRAGSSHLPVSALLSSILPVDKDSSLSTSVIPLDYANVESTLFDDDKKSTHSSTQDDQGTLPSETSHEIILSSFPDRVIEGEMQCAAPSPKQASKSSLSEKGSTLPPLARKSTCDLVDSSETKPGLPTLETAGRKPTRCLSDSLVSSCTSNDDVGLLSSLSEGHVATSVAIKELERGLATSCQDPDSLKLQPKASSKPELPLAKETSSFVDSSQGSPDLRAIESETASTFLCPIQNSENLISEIPLPLSTRESTESTEAQPIRSLSDSLISTVSLNEDLGLSNDVESYMSCLAPELFRQSKPFHEMKTEPSSRHEVSLVDTDSTSSSSLEGDEFLSADEAGDLETFPSKKESTSNILHSSRVSLEPDAVGSRNVTPFEVEGSVASLKENQSSRRLLPMPHRSITSSPVTLDLHSAKKQIQSTKPFPEQRSVSSLSVCEPTPLTLANDSKSRITESSQVSLDLHAVERESASVKSFSKQGSSTSLELHVLETESQATLSSLRPSCITRSLVKVDDATSSRIHEMITAIVKNAQICLQHKARDSETALSPQSMTSRSKRSSSATETLPLVINKETSSSTVNNSQVGLDLHSLLPSPTQRSQDTLSDTLSVITTAESTESAEPKLPRSLTKLMSLSGSFNVDAHETISGISESSQVFPDLHAVETEDPSAESFSKQDSVNSPSASEDIPLPTNTSSIIIVDNFHARLDHVADEWANEDNIRKSTASDKSEKEPESSEESEVEILATSSENVDPYYYPEDTHGLGDENVDTVLTVTLEKTREDAMLCLECLDKDDLLHQTDTAIVKEQELTSPVDADEMQMRKLSLSESIGDDDLCTGSMESTEEVQVDAMLSFESSHEDGIQQERRAAVMEEPKLTGNTDQVHSKVVSPSLGDDIPSQE